MNVRFASRVVPFVFAVFLSAASADQNLTARQGPYDLCKANWMGANYLQALINPRWNAVAFAHNTFGDKDGVGGLYFIDDQGRVIRCLVEEAENGPVARVEAVAAMARGIMAARIPGSAGRYFFTIEGRHGIQWTADGEKLVLNWLQDSLTPVCAFRLELRVGDEWRAVRFNPSGNGHGAAVSEIAFIGDAAERRVCARSFSSVLGKAPFIEVETEKPLDVRLTVSDFLPAHSIRLGADNIIKAEGEAITNPSVVESFLLLHRYGPAAAQSSEKNGWEHPSLWNTLDSMVMIAWDSPGPQLAASVEKTVTGLQLEWIQTEGLKVFAAPFLELDPADCQFVVGAAERVAQDGTFGLKPYMPVRGSNAFSGAVAGLAAAAFLLERHGHADAAATRAAAIEAFRASVGSEERGYRGEYGYNLISAAKYLSRIAPGEFEYARLTARWADREIERCPAGMVAPPWPDTALRAVRAWEDAAIITGDAKYAEAAKRALAEFDIRPDGPLDSFIWRGEPRPFEGANCTAAAMLPGQWGNRADPRAEAIISRAAPGFVCDYGFSPLRTWTCDDLPPYYVGCSLPAASGDKCQNGAKRMVGLSEFVAYDKDWKVWNVQRPDFPPPP